MKVGLLYSGGPVDKDRIDQVVGHHARALSDAGHEVRIVTGAKAPWDPRVDGVLLPEAGLDHPEVQSVQQELAAGDVSPRFHALGLRIKAALAAALRNCDVLVAYDLCTGHRHLALSAALYDLLSEHSGAVARSRPPVVLAWYHDLAWTNPRYQDELHYRYPWDLLLKPWPHVRYLALSSEQGQALAGVYGLREQAPIIVPQAPPAQVQKRRIGPAEDVMERLQAHKTIQAWLGHFMRRSKTDYAGAGRVRDGEFVATLVPLLGPPPKARRAEGRVCA